MKYLVLFILSYCQISQGVLEWTVIGKVTDYGQNVTLFCNVSNCCPEYAGWDRWTPVQSTLYIDVKSGRSSRKYDGQVLKNGYTLIIKNLTKEDLNVSYSCLYGVTLGERRFLLEKDVFKNMSTTKTNYSTVKNIFSEKEIAGVILGVGGLAAAAVFAFVYCFWKRRIKRRRNTKNISNYMNAKQSGTEIRNYVRIVVIGKQRVGKTSLVRRLLFLENGKYDGTSTDGIEIYRKCQIRKTDGKWFVGAVDTHKKAMTRRLQQAVNKEQVETEFHNSSTSVEYQLDTETNQNEQISTQSTKNVSLSKITRKEQEPLVSNDKNIGTDTLAVVTKTYIAAPTDNAVENKLRKVDKKEKQTSIGITVSEKVGTRVISADQLTEMIIKQFDGIMSSAMKDKKEKESEDLVECGIWDFAGQEDYYATHQTFFVKDAIYLIVTDVDDIAKLIKNDDSNRIEVADIEDNKKPITHKNDDLNCIEVADIEDNKKPITHTNDDWYCIEDYIDFWFDSVHSFCEDRLAEKLHPPVITVCTGSDKLTKVEEKKVYEDKLLAKYGKDRKFDHNRGIYFISNTQFTEEDSKAIKILRQRISDIARDRDYFPVKCQTKWIQLETALGILQDSKIYVYSLENMEKLAQTLSIEKEDLLRFLEYQHKIGSVIFFKQISDYIILQPDWLVRCFRCLVCDDNKEIKNNNLISPSALEALTNSGELLETVTNELFKKEPELKFIDHKTHIMNVMEKFDIVIKLHVQDSTDENHESVSYYLPCIIAKSPSVKSIRETFIPKPTEGKITPWLVLEFKFLPLAYFNSILFHFIRNYKVCKTPSLYKGKAVFYLGELSRFIICFSHNGISVQIWTWGNVEDNVYKTILNELCDNIDNIRGKLRQTISYSIKGKCSDGDYTNSEGRIILKEYTALPNYYCKEHKCPHSMDELKSTWLKHVAEREEKDIRIALQKRLGADIVKDMYEKKPGQKGLVVIVNFPFHDQPRKRSGSEVDVDNLLEFFEKELHYEVKCFEKDANKMELQCYFQEIVRIDFEENSNDYHSFICVIMSHGNEEGIETADGVISVAEIIKPFTNKPGGKFNGKPKMFLINSSRGNRTTRTLDEPYDSSKDNSYTLSLSAEIGSADEDILVAYATQLGFVAYRNVHSGSFFINAFISAAKKTYRDDHIEDILRKMIRELDFVTNSKYTNESGIRQIPVIESTFTKKFFLVE